MDRFIARKEIIKDLEKRGLYRGKKNNPMNIARCSRSGDIIEPLLKPQWYVKTQEMADRSSQYVKSGDVEIIPSHYKDEYFRWMEKIQDWCISRQLWWGHRIPAYRISTPNQANEEQWVVASSIEEAQKLAISKFGLKEGTFELHQVHFSFELLLNNY